MKLFGYRVRVSLRDVVELARFVFWTCAIAAALLAYLWLACKIEGGSL